IRTAQFVRNKCVRYWMDNKSVNKAVLYAHCKDLAKEFAVGIENSFVYALVVHPVPHTFVSDKLSGADGFIQSLILLCCAV
ncbi:hypothetical protein L5470_12575, partial [Synechococcus sp. PCC 6717]|nr:hypothetical protein [Synechococcus sp. PCC 6717]